MMRTAIRGCAIAVSAVTLITLGAGLVATSTNHPQPADDTTEVTTPVGMCPTEDSCNKPDYYNQQWHIYRVVP